MIDLHTHILPGVDDGAEDLVEALQMAEEAVKGGVTVVAATPHFFQLPDWGKIQALAADLQTELDRAGIGLKVVPGGELFMDIEIIDMAVGQIPTYGANGRYCLVEFPLQQVPLYVEQVFFSLQTKGITPIIAHPERYLAVVNDPNLVLHWIELGCAVQMNSGSILGRFGQKILETARILLEHNMVHVLATDGHGIQRRGMNLPKAFAAVEKLIGAERALQLVKGNPELIIKGEPISFAEARRYKKKKRFWIF
ncbi:MAG TPA: hypothetical protein GX008_11435 [Firmicutes bacterium]|jgi:protein-tyrosine phosphatase|nr:hypothetical protein [Bacillota bacterium]